MSAMSDDFDFDDMRRRMVERQLAARDIADDLVLAAMRKVPRHEFVSADLLAYAYDDGPLPIGEGQTISQPYIVGLMTAALGLKGGERVLEIGTGCGYAAAVLAEIAGEVYTVERVAALADRARQTLARLGYGNIHVIVGDGTLGWPDAAPYAGIVVTASGPEVPDALKTQLAIGGWLVIPVEHRSGMQYLERITRIAEDEYETASLGGVRFVRLIGEQGWRDDDGSGDGVFHGLLPF
jgi:protein-L-isoaspartate(D-aspartate) O-methyltransferase